MKLTIALLLVFTFRAEASVHAQEVTFSGKHVTLPELFEVIKRQTGYAFMYDRSLLEHSRPVAIDFKKAPLTQVLTECLESQGLTFVLTNEVIVIKKLPPAPPKAPEIVLPDTTRVEIHGRIVNDKGDPLEGATLTVKGASGSTLSGADGAFTIRTRPHATLLVSYIGYDNREIPVRGQTSLSIQLHLTNKALGDIVVIGYGAQKKGDVTSAVTTVKSDDFVAGPVTDAAELIKGKVAGLSVSNPSGDPNAQSQIILRGINTIGGANTAPLVIVDGVPGDLLTVAPEDIAEISVLKDASATAIYGVNGSNGVIIITTKRASGNVINQLDYSGNVSTSEITRAPKLLTAADYRAQIAAGTRPANYDLGSSTNWLKAVSNDVPVSTIQNLTFRGGNSQTNYLASLNYRLLDGIFLRTNHQQITGRVDINHSMLDGKLKFNLGILQTNFDDLPFNYYDYEQVFKMNPTAPVKEKDGSYYQEPSNFEYQNPVSDIYNTNQPQTAFRSKYNATITVLPVSGLRLAASGSYTKSGYLNKYFANFQNISTIRDQQSGVANISQGQDVARYLNLSAEYTRSWRAHHFSLLAGYEYQDDNNFQTYMNNHDFPTDIFGYNDIILGQSQSNGTNPNGLGSSLTQTNLISYFARGTYSYQDKYLLLASIRVDGASQLYGASEPYGKFPSVQLGWRITKEKFMENQHLFDDLKLRAGYGVTGNQPAQGFLGVALLGYGNYILYNGNWIQTLGPSQNANPQLRWEQKHETNVGLDFSLLKGFLYGSVDVYDNRTTGLLYNYNVPSPPNLYPTTEANVGTLENKGIEVSLNVAPVKTRDLQWVSSVSFSTNSNKLISLSNQLYKASVPYFTTGSTSDPIQTFTNIVQVGQPIGQLYGFKVVGVSPQGEWIYQEPDGKQVSYSQFNHAFSDKQVLGNGLPKYYLNWNNTVRYKDWDLSITMRGAFHFQVLNTLRMYYENTSIMNYNRLASSRDKVFGTAVLSQNMPLEFNSYYVENGDFWKIDNVNIGYTLRKWHTKYVQTPRIYFSTSNTFIFTHYKGVDPEVPVTGSTALNPGVDFRDAYPTIRTFTLGVTAHF